MSTGGGWDSKGDLCSYLPTARTFDAVQQHRDAIERFVLATYETDGVPPSVRDIAFNVGLSISATHMNLRHLVESGVLRKSRRKYIPASPRRG